MKQFAIIGLGRFGTSLAKTLNGMGHEVMAVDISEERVEELAGFVTHAVQVDAIDEHALKELGIRNFDVVTVAIGQDIQASILVTLTLKEIGVRKVVAKAINEQHGKVLEKVGADRVVYPERDSGVRLAHQMASPNVLEYIELSSDYSVEEIVADRLAGKTIGQLNLRAKYGISVICIKRGADNIIIAPGAQDLIQKGDVVVVIGKKKALARMEE